MNKYEWNISKITNAVKESINFTEVLDKLGVSIHGNNYKTLRNILDTNNIDYSHFTGRAREAANTYIEAAKYLNTDKKIKTSKLKNKLIKENIIENKCDVCGLTTWLNKPIVLQLHHIDGNPSNNSLENLQLLCPNCHSQTDNYCGSANTDKTKYYCVECGAEITKRATYCSMCARKHTRKVVDRPTKEQLIQDYLELKSFVQLGRKYGITDNAIRKWFKMYDLPTVAKDLKEYVKQFS